jgi:hypothetical protein
MAVDLSIDGRSRENFYADVDMTEKFYCLYGVLYDYQSCIYTSLQI